MRIKSTVLQVLAAACLGAGLLYAMGIEGGAQLGQPVSDGEFVTALVLVLAAVFFMRKRFAAPESCGTWNWEEIDGICRALHIPQEQIGEYFFPKVEKGA